jgi:hypothetical protein
MAKLNALRMIAYVPERCRIPVRSLLGILGRAKEHANFYQQAKLHV